MLQRQACGNASPWKEASGRNGARFRGSQTLAVRGDHARMPRQPLFQPAPAPLCGGRRRVAGNWRSPQGDCAGSLWLFPGIREKEQALRRHGREENKAHKHPICKHQGAVAGGGETVTLPADDGRNLKLLTAKRDFLPEIPSCFSTVTGRNFFAEVPTAADGLCRAACFGFPITKAAGPQGHADQRKQKAETGLVGVDDRDICAELNGQFL